MSRLFIILGIVFLLIGLFWPIILKFNLGHLPGDIIIKRENVTIYFPIVTCIVISIIITIIFWLFNR